MVRGFIVVVALSLMVIQILPGSQSAAVPSKRHDDLTHEEFCQIYVCPYMNAPSCNCREANLPTWTRRKRLTDEMRVSRVVKAMLERLQKQLEEEQPSTTS